MLPWSLAGILEKNKLANDKPFLVFVQVDVDGIPEPIRLVRDNQDQTWNGQVWQRFPVDFDKVTEDGKEIPSVNLKVSNVQGVVQGYVQQYRGLCDAPVKIMIVHAAHLDNPVPEIELDFVITQTKYDEQWVTFSIGASNDHSFRFPFWRYMTNFCPFHFKDIQCGYAGGQPECDGTLTTCRIPVRFGGEPGIQSATSGM
jgi:phage-related protein